MGVFGYYQKFIRDYSKKARPLTKLIEKNVEFIWGPEQEEARQLLKEELVMPPVLLCTDPKVQFILDRDARASEQYCPRYRIKERGS